MSNPFADCKTELKVGEEAYSYYSFEKLNDPRIAKLPYSIRVLLESALRNADGFEINKSDVENILNWNVTSKNSVEIPYKPARVILQDFTGVPSVVDLAAMREAVSRLGGDPNVVNPLVPAELVIDHSVQVDVTRSADAVQKNLEIEMDRNKERFQFLKWGQESFQNFRVVPPGSGIVHQVNLEYLARVVFKDEEGMLYPDSCVGTDSHTTMVNGLGVTGWGVGGLEAEAVMMGTAISMVLPEVVGYKLTGKLQQHVTATDMVLTIVQNLRKFPGGVVGKFVEFFGDGLESLTLADRATIANMGPEYGATQGFFPVDERTMEYMRNTNRSPQQCAYTEAYLKAQGMFFTKDAPTPEYTATLELDLSTVVSSVAGPKRPQDRVPTSALKEAFTTGLTAPVSFSGFGLSSEEAAKTANLTFNGKEYTLRHGAVVIAAITSCTNTSNPAVLIAAGLVAKAAVEKGLSINDYVKTSLAPGSHVVTEYLKKSGLLPYLEQIGFGIVGYGCTTCIGNSGELLEGVDDAIDEAGLVASAVLSGNRNFEGRVHANVRAAWLASPPLVVAYALAGTTDFDFETQPLGKDKSGEDVFLRDIWPTNDEIAKICEASVLQSMFKEVYDNIEKGTDSWNALPAEKSTLYKWDEKSTYIHHPPFFQTMGKEPSPTVSIKDARCLLNLGDSITTDHISPAGSIARNSPAARYLEANGVQRKDFNTYGARRGNDLVMGRGTFANIRLVNKLVSKAGPTTLHVDSNEEMPIFDAAERYQADGHQLIILGGAMYGNGSSRDWAAKGPWMQGVKAVIAVSFERIHRSNLVGMGILPLVFEEGHSADTLGLDGKEHFSIELPETMAVGDVYTVTTNTGKTFKVLSRLDTNVDIKYYQNGGILHTVIRNLLAK